MSPAPSLTQRLIDSFLGMAPDTNGKEVRLGQFELLTNVRNESLASLRVRPGSGKVFSQSHNTGSVVRGLHTYIDPTGSPIYLKLNGANLFKSTGGAWSSVGSSFTDADAFFATAYTRKTGASADATGTATSGTSTSIVNSGASMTPAAHVGKVIVINGETKLISANDATTIFVSERLDKVPASGDSYSIYPRQQEAFFANGTDFYKTDGSTNTRIDNSNYAFAFTGVEVHGNRLMGWKKNRLHWADSGVGEHFSRNAWKDFPTDIKRVKSFGDVLVIYEADRVSVMFGDNPDNFFFRTLINGVGCSAPKSVANYGNYQFFLSEQQGVVFLTTENTRIDRNTLQSLSISKDYIQDSIDAFTSNERSAACGVVHNDSYHLFIGNTTFVLNVKASLLANLQSWVWAKDTRPAAMNANVLGLFGSRLVAGSNSSGQVYELDTGTDDDGTAITYTIKKSNWIMGNYGRVDTFWQLLVSQNTSVSAISQSYKVAVDDGSETTIKTIDLSTYGKSNQSIPITSNPTVSAKNVGKAITVTITGTVSVAVPAIEKIGILYVPGITS